MIEKIFKVDGNNIIAVNVVFHTSGIIPSNENIAYLCGLCNNLEKIDKNQKVKFHRKNDYLKKKI